ncbi:MAG TPA: 1-deoxy-D-xylulose-5-phosphate reductoisomerase [Candidatus Limnocylindrales bacterium]|nr:1-deoxy-D-xylulose-5-phosphate reductoisomerase [Candidatus Limnocylindrales bacterium]
MKKNISILGSTGSVGRNTLEIVENFPENFQVWGLAAHKNIDLLEKQIKKFKPRIASLSDPALARQLKERCRGYDVEILSGEAGAVRVATIPEVDLVVSAMVGAAGLIPTFAAISHGKDIALANKETLVTAGEIITHEARRKDVRIVPVDSEHSAILQAMQGHDPSTVKCLILTASGGPFKNHSLSELQNVTLEEALQHPTWNMGQKITIDSATLMNKGLEVIEARWLFNIPLSRIKIVIHPQSIVHSMVEYIDGSVIAQLGIPDMKIPISYALAYPERLPLNLPSLELTKLGNLSFQEPDFDRFPCLRYAYQAGEEGGSLPIVVNASNEVAVEFFLKKKIRFVDIQATIGRVMEEHSPRKVSAIEEVLEIDQWARREAEKVINQER